jgi:glycerophosphoryl diester phosphodiesterase
MIAALLILFLAMTSSAYALDVQGHRGARGLLPENTLPAFARALEIGVTTLELDCGLTKDGVVVIAHDRALNPDFTRDAGGRWIESAGPAIHDLTYSELRRYDVGRIRPGTPYAQRFARQQGLDGMHVPRLSDLFLLVRERGDERLRFNIETKLSPLAPGETAPPDVLAKALIEAVRQAGMETRVTIQSFDWRTLQVVQKEAPAIPTVYLTAVKSSPRNVAPGSPWTAGFQVSDYGSSIPRTVKAAGGAAWSPAYGELTLDALREAQALGLKVVPWTVNSEADMKRLIEWGVDGIISDYPDVLKKVATARGGKSER